MSREILSQETDCPSGRPELNSALQIHSDMKHICPALAFVITLLLCSQMDSDFEIAPY